MRERAKDYAAMELATVNPGGIEEFNRLYRNKFAEFIVRECAGLAGRNHLFLFREKILEHFGVEE